MKLLKSRPIQAVGYIGTRSPMEGHEHATSQHQNQTANDTCDRHIPKALYNTVHEELQLPSLRLWSSYSSLVLDKLYIVLAINLYQLYPD